MKRQHKHASERGRERQSIGTTSVGHSRHSLSQPVVIHGVPCVMAQAAEGYVVREGGGVVAEAPTRFLAVARAATAILARVAA